MSTILSTSWHVYLTSLPHPILWISVGIITVSASLWVYSILIDRRLSKEMEKMNIMRFQALFDCHPDMVFSIDSKDKIINVNKSAYEEVKYVKRELLDQSIYSLFPHDQAEILKYHMYHIKKGNSDTIELSIKHHDGRLIETHVTGIPVLIDQQIIGIYMIAKNVSLQKKLKREQIQMEEELKTARDHLESFLQNTSDAIHIMDLEGKITKINHAFEIMYGWTAEEVLFQSPPNIPESEQTIVKQQYQNIGEGITISTVESQRIHKIGHLIHVSVTLSPIRNAKGEIVAIAEVARDHSRIKNTEMALKESEERYRSLIENSPDAMIIHDYERIIYINSAGLKLLGYSHILDLNKPSFLQYIHSKDQHLLEYHISNVLNKREKIEQFEIRVIRSDGEVVIVETVLIPFIYEGQAAVQLIVRDVTERSHMEAVLRQHKESLAKAQKIAMLGNWDLTLHSETLYVSDEVYRIFDVNPKERISELTQFYQHIHKDDQFAVEQAIDQALLGHKASLEHRIQCSNGTNRTVYHHIEKMIDELSDSEHIIGTLQDITERKVTEEMLKRSEKLSVVGQMAAGVAHEIRNPLTSIKGFIQLFQRGSIKQEYFPLILSEIDRMEMIISEFLLLAKPQANKFEWVTISEIIDDVIPLVKTQAIFNHVVIDSKISKVLPAVQCEVSQIKQLFINVLNNAIESMSHGGKVEIDAELHQDQFIYIAIKDEGCGISEERLNKLGEPFYSTKEKGTGLGLMLSYKIIEDHHGMIRINSVLDEGTQVKIYLPFRSFDKEN